MNLSTYILDQAFRRLRIPASAREQFQIAGELSNVEGRGFPPELFQLSAPVILRGLLNYAVLQMRRDWVFPYWAHQQFDPRGPAFIPRSQNPLLINITHRNWTLLGTPHGRHEAIVDPRGLVTPLPREWSVDVWLVTPESVFFPSLAGYCEQRLTTDAPCVVTESASQALPLRSRQFVGTTRRGLDVLFAEATVRNSDERPRSGALAVAIRPFNPEGIAPIRKIEFRGTRQVFVNGLLGVVFGEEPAWVACSSDAGGDLATRLSSAADRWSGLPASTQATCPTGLAHGVAIFPFTLAPGEEHRVRYSIALGTEKELRRFTSRGSWRVSFERRLEDHRKLWEDERRQGAVVRLPVPDLQRLTDASLLALLELCDRDFVSPGPWLYHHFWFRDAAPMLSALDAFGFHKRVREVIDDFGRMQTGDGFFRAPDGEWDSNGAVLWLIGRHQELTDSVLWLRRMLPSIEQAVRWIARKRRQRTPGGDAVPGMMPPSLSAEHFGTVDQYYWDSFWSLAGLRAAARLAAVFRRDTLAAEFRSETRSFEEALRTSLQKVRARLGRPLIPATPLRGFDESAIGAVAAIHPLDIDDLAPEFFDETLHELTNRFVDERGFFHPFIHSGYNAYLTLQIAHGHLLRGRTEQAWTIAHNLFQLASPTGAFPEAVHPRTLGGAMGDGHHGWAAAEVVLFVRSLLIDDRSDRLAILRNWPDALPLRGVPLSFERMATRFGPWSFALRWEEEGRVVVESIGDPARSAALRGIDIHLPFTVSRVRPVNTDHLQGVSSAKGRTVIHCSPGMRRLLLEV